MIRQDQDLQSSDSDNEQKPDESVNQLSEGVSQMNVSEESASRDQSLNTQKSREARAKELTKPAGGKQAGRIPVFQKEPEARACHPFSSARERQLLRQVATQLYFYLKKYNKDDQNKEKELVEIQIMHLDFEGKHNLFIAANKHSFSQRFSELITTDREKFVEILCTDYLREREDTDERRVRSKRYSKKLDSRIKKNRIKLLRSSETVDKDQATHVARLLKEATISFPEIGEDNNQALFEKGNNLYFITPNYKVSDKARHAEEFLCDIAEEAKSLSNEVHASVGGKKRPCKSCHGRMKELIDEYNPYSGLAYVHGIKYQTQETAKKTEKILHEEKAYVSLNKSGDKSFKDLDSGSDSEDEETLLKPFISKIPWCEEWEEEVIEAIRATQVDVEELQAISEIGDVPLLLDEGYPLSELVILYRKESKYIDIEKLETISKIGGVPLLLDEGYSLLEVVTLCREDSFHITCLTYIANDQLEDLILDLAPEVNPIAMSYVRKLKDEYDTDILSWVGAQLGESDQMLWDANLDYYWNTLSENSNVDSDYLNEAKSYEEDISKKLQNVTFSDLEEDDIKRMATLNLISTPDKSTHATEREFSDSPQAVKPSVPDGLSYQRVSGDGHCFYHAVALYLGSTQEELRRVTAEYIENNSDHYREGYVPPEENNTLSFDSYLQGIRDGSVWADHIEINALTRHLNQPIVVIGQNNAVRNRMDLIQENGSLSFSGAPIFVYYNGRDHYDGLTLNNTVSAHTLLGQLLNRSDNPENQSEPNIEETTERLLSCKAEAGSEKGIRKEDSDDSDEEQTQTQRMIARTIAPHTETNKAKHQETSEKTATQPDQASDSVKKQTHEAVSEEQQISAKTPARKTLKELHEQEMDFYAAPFEACAPALAGLIERLHSVPGPELVTLLSRHDFMKRVSARGNDTDVQAIFFALESAMARGELSSQALLLFLKDNVISHLEEREAALKTHFFVLLRKMLHSTETADAISNVLKESLVQSSNMYRLDKVGGTELLELLHEIRCFSSNGYADIVPIIERVLYPLAATLRKNTRVSVNEASLLARRVLRLVIDASTGELRPEANPVLSGLLGHPNLSRKYKEALLAGLDPQTHRQYRAMLTRWDRIATAWDRLWKRKGYLASPESGDLSLLALQRPQLLELGHASLVQYSDDELDTIEHLLSDSFLSDVEQIEEGIEALEMTETLLKEFKVNNTFELTLYFQILSLTVLGKERRIEDQLVQWQKLHRVISHAPSTDWCDTMCQRIQDKIESIEQFIHRTIEEITTEVRTQVEHEFEASWSMRAQKIREEVCADYQFDLSIDNEDIEEMIPRRPDQKECFDFWSEIHPNLKSSIRQNALDKINQSMNLSHGMNEKKNDIEVQAVAAETTDFMDKNLRERIATLAIATTEDVEVMDSSTEKIIEEYQSEKIIHRAKIAFRHRWEAEESHYKEKIDEKLETWNRRDIGQMMTRKQSVEEPAVMARPEWSESGAVADIERRLESLSIFNREILERDLPDVPDHSLGFFEENANVQKKSNKSERLSHVPTNS